MYHKIHNIQSQPPARPQKSAIPCLSLLDGLVRRSAILYTLDMIVVVIKYNCHNFLSYLVPLIASATKATYILHPASCILAQIRPFSAAAGVFRPLNDFIWIWINLFSFIVAIININWQMANVSFHYT